MVAHPHAAHTQGNTPNVGRLSNTRKRLPEKLCSMLRRGNTAQTLFLPARTLARPVDVEGATTTGQTYRSKKVLSHRIGPFVAREEGREHPQGSIRRTLEL